MSSEKEDPHDKAVRAIAKKRFNFPTRTKPDYKTWVNTKDNRVKGVKTNADTIYPDILVTNSKNVAVMAGEIETDATINEDEAKQWNEYSRVCGSCYVYVPKGFEAPTKKLIQKGNFSVSGVRTYRFEDSKIILTDV